MSTYYKRYNIEQFSPEYVAKNPVRISIEFSEMLYADMDSVTLGNDEIVANSIKLRQSLCSEPYYMPGGCNASELKFQCVSETFTRGYMPTGKVRLAITPTSDGGETEISELKTYLFTGYVDSAVDGVAPGMYTVTAYDKLHRLQNIDFAAWFNSNIYGHGNITISEFAERACLFLTGQAGVFQFGQYDGACYVPNNKRLSSMDGAEALREICFMHLALGTVDGDGNFCAVNVEPNVSDELVDVTYYKFIDNNFDKKNLRYSTSYVWRPKVFVTSEPQDLFRTRSDSSAESEYYNNVYTIKNNLLIGDSEWARSMYECDEYGVPSQKYSASVRPEHFLIIDGMEFLQTYNQQEYNLKAYMDPTIPLGSAVSIVDETKNISYVTSYIMERTINLKNSRCIYCEISAKNSPYNSAAELPAELSQAIADTEHIRTSFPVISDAGSMTKLKAVKVLTKAEYTSLTEKRDDTLYYVIDDGGTT